jgi:hypothetical protein
MRAILDNISKRFFLITVVCTMFISLSLSAAVDPIAAMATSKPWVILAIMVWEYLVGKTKLVKANSTLEMIENILKMIFGIGQDDLKAF